MVLLEKYMGICRQTLDICLLYACYMYFGCLSILSTAHNYIDLSAVLYLFFDLWCIFINFDVYQKIKKITTLKYLPDYICFRKLVQTKRLKRTFLSRKFLDRKLKIKLYNHYRFFAPHIESKTLRSNLTNIVIFFI